MPCGNSMPSIPLERTTDSEGWADAGTSVRLHAEEKNGEFTDHEGVPGLFGLAVRSARQASLGGLHSSQPLSPTTIKRLWRRPYGRANVETLDKIAGVLGVSVPDLIEHVPDEGKET